MSIGNSPGTISGFTLQGDYLVELRRHTALGDYCSDVYDQVHVIASEIPVKPTQVQSKYWLVMPNQPFWQEMHLAHLILRQEIPWFNICPHGPKFQVRKQ